MDRNNRLINIKTDSNTYLLNYRKNIFSQYGEDGILDYIFKLIPEKNNWSVEFGAWDGRFASNTCNLINNHNWHGIFIEADKIRYKDFIKNHGHNNKVIFINKCISLEGSNRLDNLLKRINKLPINFDLLSIDIDSCDYYVWQSLSNYKPKIVIIEFNPTIPVGYEYVQERNFSIHDEHSLTSVVKLGKAKGYELICCTDTNAFFVINKYYPLFKINNNSAETLFHPYEGYYQTKVWQGGDGTLHFIGCRKLLWHNIVFNEKKLQVLPKYLRFFPGTTHPFWQLFKKIYYQFPVVPKLMNLFLVGKKIE